jgi:hypothetical protein
MVQMSISHIMQQHILFVTFTLSMSSAVSGSYSPFIETSNVTFTTLDYSNMLWLPFRRWEGTLLLQFIASEV